MPAKEMPAKNLTNKGGTPQGEPGAPAAAEPGPPARADERRAPRRPSNGPAFVRIAGYRLNLPCRIADMSATGARLILTDTKADHLPDRIIIAFSDRTEIDAEIRWRRERECGVRFVSFFRQSPPSTPR